jgi:NADPH2:quinone reductase
MVKIRAISINPVDYKHRRSAFWYKEKITDKNPLILGYDAVGEVIDVGKEVKFFKKGD